MRSGPVSIWSMEKLVWVQNYKLRPGYREILDYLECVSASDYPSKEDHEQVVK